MKHRKFPSPQISEAVFRGRKTPYSFEVYPLNIEFNPVPAVYIISRRKIDKLGRAHHQIVSVGQTESLAAEVKTQRRNKTLKDFQADTVSVLLSDNENSRAAIEEDLKAVYGLRCLRKPEIKKPALKFKSLRTKALTATISKTENSEVKSEGNQRKTAKLTVKVKPPKFKDVTTAKSLKPKKIVQKSVKDKPVESRLKSKTVNPKPASKVVRPKLKPEAKTEVKKKKTVEVPGLKKAKTAGRKTVELKSKVEKKVKDSKVKTVKQPVIVKAKNTSKKELMAKAVNPKTVKKLQIVKPKKAGAKVSSKKIEASAVNKKINKVKAKTTKGKTVNLPGKTLKPKKQPDVKSKAPIEKKGKAQTKKSVMPKAKTGNNKQQAVQVKTKIKKPAKTIVPKRSKNQVRNRLAI